MKHLLRHAAMIAATVFIASGCEDLPLTPTPSPDDTAPKVSILTSISNYTKATDTEFENGDAISLSIVTPTAVFLDNCKFTYGQGGWTAKEEVKWYSENVPSVVTALYPAVSGSMKDYYPLGNSPIEFTVQSDQTTHSGYTGSDLMLATKEGVYPSEEAVSLEFKHLLSKVVINVNNQVDKNIDAIFLSGVYGKGVITNEYQVDGEKASIKAAAVANPNSGYTHSFQVIVPPQTAKPVLIVSMTDGEAYEYELPEEVVFSSGKVRTAGITITSESISAAFNGDILNWTADPELNFSQPHEPVNPDDPGNDDPNNPGEETPQWVSLGYGRFIETFLAPFGVTPEEWMVEYEQNTDSLGLYRLKNPYTNENSPYKDFATSDRDSYIYFHVLNNERVYVEAGHIGISIGEYGEIYGGSLCPENQWEQSSYGSLIENGNVKYIRFPANSMFVSFKYEGQDAYFYGLEHPYAVYTFPDKERKELMELWNGIEVSENENDNITYFTMRTGIDMPENSLKFYLVEGAHQNESNSIAEGMLNGEYEAATLNNKKGCNQVTASMILATGTYTAIVAYRSTTSDGFYYYYNTFSHLVPGEEAPGISINELTISPEPTAPEYCADIKIVAPGAIKLGTALIDDNTFQALGKDNETLIAYVKENGKFLQSQTLIEKSYLTRFENELEPDTHYNYLIYVENGFGSSDFSYSDFTTAKEDESKWSVLPQKGEYYDNLWRIGYEFEPFFNMPPVEVIIEKYGDLPRYKVLSPYLEYWTGTEGGEIYKSLPDRDRNIEFWIKDFDYLGEKQQGIYYRPFTTGGRYSESEYTSYLMPYSYFSKMPSPRDCTADTGDVFHLNGWFEVMGGRSAKMGYQFYGKKDMFVVSLSKGAYASPYMLETKGSWNSPLKPERLIEGSYLQTCKSYTPKEIKTSSRNIDWSLRESAQKIR